MGCYDSVWFKCPGCGARVEAQSKAGECNMEDIEHTAVPVQIAADLNGQEVCCPNCGKCSSVMSLGPSIVPCLLV